MPELDPLYLSALAAQIGSLSAFLGGFAATYLGTLLALGQKGRAAGWAIGAAVLASVAFIVTVVASTLLVAAYDEHAPAFVRDVLPLATVRVLMSLGFVTGLYALLASLACSGWPRSRRTGWTTSIVAGIGMLLVTWLLVQFR
ncbi:MAG TPA: hypothetical protein VMG08_04735 [Allosphingosinicella sp.]|nr:hypothetical protein [Allosphingosinicella sp.]